MNDNISKIAETKLSDNEATAPPTATNAEVVPETLTLESKPASRLFPTISGYEILDELGRGGMGVVYRARQSALKRLVAIKMILAGEYAGDVAVSRFRAEAEAVAKLQHPNIVQIHHIGEENGLPYFTMEFVEGSSLDKKLSGKPLSPQHAAQLVEALARAMHVAHQKGIVHRDLKPGNILLSLDNTPKITDFGLAKRLGEEGRTVSGSILGTPAYMAPEQASGQTRRIGPAVDVYALGAIFYEMLTGRPPFRAPSLAETLDQVRFQDPIPPRRHQPLVPVDLEAICLQCLKRRPEERYASAAALADDLQIYLAGGRTTARKWPRRRMATVAATALAFIIVGAATTLWSMGAIKRESQTPLNGSRPSTTSGLGKNDAISNNFAFLVGVRDYRLKQYSATLKYTEADVEELAKVLHRCANYPKKHITILSQWTQADDAALAPTADNLRLRLREFLRDRTDSDTVLVALTGTGWYFGEPATYCFLPSNADGDDVKSLISLPEIYDLLGECRAKLKILLIDTCQCPLPDDVARQVRSPSWPKPKSPPPGLAAFFACSPGESSVELDDLKHGLFSYYFIEGLGGKADANQDGIVQLSELENFTKDSVKAYAQQKSLAVRQTPMLISTVPATVGVAGVPTQAVR